MDVASYDHGMNDRPSLDADVLADRRVFVVSPVAWVGLMAALDRPAKEVPGLDVLLRSPTVLDGP